MPYFEVTILKRGKKEKFGLFASDKKEVNDYASLKYSGIIIKVEKATQPVELVLKQLKTKLLKKIKKRTDPIAFIIIFCIAIFLSSCL